MAVHYAAAREAEKKARESTATKPQRKGGDAARLLQLLHGGGGFSTKETVDMNGGEEGGRPKLYILHDNPAWMKAWRPTLRDQFGETGVEEWVLDGKHSAQLEFGMPPPMGIFFCKGSGSAHARGHPCAAGQITAVLQWLEFHRRTVVNGSRAYAAEVSKMTQLAALGKFGFSTPAAMAVFGAQNLVHAAESFEKEHGGGFWIRLNRSSCGRGVWFCESAADADAFLSNYEGANDVTIDLKKCISHSGDEIYILQEFLRSPVVLRLEFAFGRLLYATEVEQAEGDSAVAPCGCMAQRDAGSQPGSAPVYGVRTPTSGCATPIPARLLAADALHREYPIAAQIERAAKKLMDDLGAGTLALEVILVDGEPVVIDMNIHSNYDARREKAAGLPFEHTGVGAICAKLKAHVSLYDSDSESGY